MTYLYGHRSLEIAGLQRALAALNLYRGGIDGACGPVTRAAVMRAQQLYSLDPADGVVRDDLLLELGITKPKPKKTNPLQDWLIGLAIKQAVSRLKGLPMLSGYKTYATAAVIAVMGLYSLFFGELPLVGMSVDPGGAVMALLSALGLAFGRTGAPRLAMIARSPSGHHTAADPGISCRRP